MPFLNIVSLLYLNDAFEVLNDIYVYNPVDINQIHWPVVSGNPIIASLVGWADQKLCMISVFIAKSFFALPGLQRLLYSRLARKSALIN